MNLKNQDKDPNSRHYFSEIPKKEVEQTFDEVVLTDGEIVLWQKGKSEKTSEEFEILNYDREKHVIKLKRSGGILSKLRKSPLTGRQVYVKIPFDRYHYFTTSYLHYEDEGVYSLILSTELYKCQQRTNYRLQSGPTLPIQIRIEEDLFDCLDVSAGGASFLIPKDRSEDFLEGTVFKEIRLGVVREKFNIPQVRVAKVTPQTNRDGEKTNKLRIGLAFEEMPKPTEREMVQIINSFARAEELRRRMGS